MSNRGSVQFKRLTTNDDDPQGLSGLMNQYCEWMLTRGLSEYTVHRRSHVLRNFAVWCEYRDLTRPQDITKPILERYQRYLYHFRSANGAPLSFRTQKIYLSGIQGYFRFLAKRNFILSNPASDLDLPRCGKRLPRDILSISEVEQILSLPNVTDEMGIRDRAILETLYSTGIRRLELVNLSLFDVDIDRGTLMIREGKGRKDRMIPIGERALAWIQKYLEEVRPSWVIEPDHGFFFLGVNGEPLSPVRLTMRVGEYVEKAGIGKKGSCHMFRHTMATLMLEGGADVRYIQQMLGHSSLDTTSIYTQVSIRKLQEIYLATHPGAKLKRKNRKQETPEREEKQIGTKEKLFSTLAAEAKEEDTEETTPSVTHRNGKSPHSGGGSVPPGGSGGHSKKGN